MFLILYPSNHAIKEPGYSRAETKIPSFSKKAFQCWQPPFYALIVDIKTRGLALLPLCTSNGVYVSGRARNMISSDTL